MSEMIERVALAISGGDDPASILKIHRHRARAAIKAMREPTEAMVTAGAGAEDHEFGVIGLQPATEAWRLMIDEALK